MWAHPGWQFVLFALAVMITGIVAQYPGIEISYLLIFIGSYVALLGLWCISWSKWGSKKSQYVRMDEAIRYLFEYTNAADEVRDRFGLGDRGETGRRTYHYNQIRHFSRAGYITILGCRPPSQNLEPMKDSDFLGLTVSDDFTKLKNGEFVLFSNLSVPRGRLKRIARRIKQLVRDL